jgi:hypothetical protein
MKMPLKLCGLAALAVVAVAGCAQILGVDFGEKTGSLDGGSGGTGNGGTGGVAPECSNVTDCVAACPGETCACIDNKCTTAECSTTADCVAKYGAQDAHACIEFGCRKLLSPECTSLSGDWQSENALFIGVLDDRSSPFAKVDKVEYYLESARLARKQIEDAATGPGKNPRKVVLVECDELMGAQAAAEHLVDDLRIPLLIGPSTSPAQLEVFNSVLVPRKESLTDNVVMLTDSGFDAVLTDARNSGIAWSIAPSATARAFAVARVFEDNEADLRARMSLSATDPLKVAVVTLPDPGFDDLTEQIEDAVVVNGTKLAAQDPSTYRRIVSAELGQCSTGCNVDADRQALLDFRPHFVITNGPTGLFNAIVKPVENAWELGPNGGCSAADGGGQSIDHRPFYVAAVWDYTMTGLVGCPFGVLPEFELWQRILATDFYPNVERYSQFIKDYRAFVKNSTFAGNDQRMGLAYDAMYFAIYAFALLLKDDENRVVTGKDIASAFESLGDFGGDALGTGKADIAQILNNLATNKTVNLQGTFGELRLNKTKHSSVYDISILCPNANNGAEVPWKQSGQTFSVINAALEGTSPQCF